MAVTRAGGSLGIPGLYVTEDPGARRGRQRGHAGIRIGLGWAKSHASYRPVPGDEVQPPVMQCILYEKIQIAKAVNVTMISLDEGPMGYKNFDQGGAGENSSWILHRQVAA